jgi:hypothetical protein
MARRINRKELCEAIRQSQARMQEKMQGAVRTEPPPPKRLQLKYPAPRGERRPKRSFIPARIRHFRVNPRGLAGIAIGILFIVGVVLLTQAMDRSPTVETPEANQTARAVSNDLPMRPPASGTPSAPSSPRTSVVPPRPVEREPVRPPIPVVATPPAPQGDHVVVIATYTQRDLLVPVQDFFNANGIETDIMRSGSYYLVVTKQRFTRSQRSEAAGREMLRRISEIGAQYKAPPGYLSFAKSTFDSAYWKNVGN